MRDTGSDEETKAVEVRAEIRQVKTMADFTINLTLNLEEGCIEQAKKLLEWQGDIIRAIIVHEVTNDGRKSITNRGSNT